MNNRNMHRATLRFPRTMGQFSLRDLAMHAGTWLAVFAIGIGMATLIVRDAAGWM